MQKNGIIGFFYMDNIVFAFKKKQYDKVERLVSSLLKVLTIERKRELKWFLGLYIIHGRLKRALWLLQKAYIMKICNNLALSTNKSQLPVMPIKILELLAVPKSEEITNTFWTLY